MVSAGTKRTILAVVGVLTFAVWVIQAMNAVTMDYKFATYTSNNVLPGAVPGAQALTWNVWIVLLPLIVLTALVMFTLTRWAIDSASTGWMVAHVIAGIALAVVCVVMLIVVLVSFLAGSDWQKNNWNMAADERLCCLRPSISIPTPVIPGCPVLFNNCSPDLSLTPDSSMHWNLAFRWFFALLFVDIVLAIALVVISFWIGNVIDDGKGHTYTTISAPVQTTTNINAPLGSGIVSLKTLRPIGTLHSNNGKQDHLH